MSEPTDPSPEPPNQRRERPTNHAAAAKDAQPQPGDHAAAAEDAQPQPANHATPTEDTPPQSGDHAAAAEDARPEPANRTAPTEDIHPQPTRHAAAAEDTYPQPADHATPTEDAQPQPGEHAAAAEHAQPQPTHRTASTEDTYPQPADHVAAAEDARPQPTNHAAADEDTRPRPAEPLAKLRKVALTCLYLLIIAATLWVLGQVVARLSVIVVPLAVALLLASLFAPGVTWLVRHRVPRGLATAIVLLTGLAAVGGLIYFMVSTLVDGLPDLGARLDESYRQLRDWLTNGPAGLTAEQLDRVLEQAQDWLSRNRSRLASGAFGVLATAAAILAGLAVVVFLLIFFLHDGARMWRGTTEFLPEPGRTRVRAAGARAFHDLTAYVRTTLLVALIDAVAIGLGLWVTGVPLVLPLSALVFFGAFVPIIGAFVTGIVAVLVALVSQGLVVALVVAGVVIAVQQLEGNVLEPLLMSRSVKLHPVAILVAITVGVELAGIVGALFAVPVLATVRAVFRSNAT